MTMEKKQQLEDLSSFKNGDLSNVMFVLGGYISLSPTPGGAPLNSTEFFQLFPRLQAAPWTQFSRIPRRPASQSIESPFPATKIMSKDYLDVPRS